MSLLILLIQMSMLLQRPYSSDCSECAVLRGINKQSHAVAGWPPKWQALLSSCIAWQGVMPTQASRARKRSRWRRTLRPNDNSCIAEIVLILKRSARGAFSVDTCHLWRHSSKRHHPSPLGHGYELVGGHCRPVRHARPILPTHVTALRAGDCEEDDIKEDEERDNDEHGEVEALIWTDIISQYTILLTYTMQSMTWNHSTINRAN